jgi:hypothetical protein
VNREAAHPERKETGPIHESRFTGHDPLRSFFPALDAFLFVFLANLVLQPLVEPDFGWHLRTGLDLIKNGWRVPPTDPYSHTMPDWPWVEHAWLTDGILGLLYSGLPRGGGLALIVLFAAIAAGAFLLSAQTAKAGRTPRRLAVAAVAWVALPFLGARIQVITWLGLAIVLVLWDRYLRGATWPLWGLPVLFLAWANLHGGFTAGLFAWALMMAGSVAVRLLTVYRPRLAARLDEPVLTWRRIGALVAALVVSTVLTLINPYGPRLYVEIYESLTDRFMIDSLQEWQPLSLERLAGEMYLAYLLVLGAGTAMWYRKVEPVRWLMWLAFLVLSLRHWRNVPFFLIASLPLCADMVSAAASTLTRRLPAIGANVRRWGFGLACAAAMALVALGSEHLERVVRCGIDPAGFFEDTDYPIEAVDWVHRHRSELGSRLYNDYGLGGFLVWWLPQEKIFIDGRMPAWRVADRWIFRDYVALAHQDPPALGVMDKYRVEWGITAAGGVLDQAIQRAPGWRHVYEDRKVRIFARR